jgi:hypothetical protein
MRAVSPIFAAGSAGLALCLAAASASADTDLLIQVTVTGAVARVGAYRHDADAAHRCVPALEVPPGPTPGSQFVNLPFTVDFDSAARPPADSFRLEIPSVGQAAGRQRGSTLRVAMTAEGRLWEGDNTSGSGFVETETGGWAGRFHIDGLHTAGSTETISVDGSWSCPHAT